MLNFTAENRPTKLWIPQDSGFVEHTDWLQDNFPNDMRFNSYIFLAENVLNTKHLLTVRFFDVPFPFRSNSFFSIFVNRTVSADWKLEAYKARVAQRESDRLM